MATEADGGNGDPINGAHGDFSKAMSYGDYLHLPELLAAQHCLSDRHDELLFVVIHQTSELWMKLILHELSAAREMIARGELQPAFKGTARVSKIMDLLVQSWGILATLTPAEYLSFREKLGQSSGFQSAQYRTIEFLLGNKSSQMLEVFRHQPDEYRRLQQELARSSLYDEAITALSARGFAIDAAVLTRNVATPHALDESVVAAWLAVYREPDKYWDLYELAEELLDLEDCFQQWRFRHVTTVKRIIGFKSGTGGTAGVPYLRKALDVVLFPELWEVRTRL